MVGTFTAAVLGGTGLVGSALLRLAAASGRYRTLRALVRREGVSLPDGAESIVVDFERLAAHEPQLDVDHVFCCLGTTIKQAGSKAAFRRVDLELPLLAARTAHAAGARQFVIVTAVGAKASSSVFYNRVKGELEDALRALEFPEGLTILHPSLLLGDRAEKRVGEGVASVFMRVTRPLFVGPLEAYRAIEDVEVARAMLAAAEKPVGGVRVLEGRSLFELAR